MKTHDENSGLTDEENKEYDIFDPAKKIKETPRMRKALVGNKDELGNKITNILAKAEEYVIYEIETDDINNKLRFITDGWSNERDAALAEAYIKVKEQYIIAKGLLYRSNNAGIMKNRVAHALATALSLRPTESLTQFSNLIRDINEEYKASYRKRIYYSLSGYLALVFLVILNHCSKHYSEQVAFWVKILLVASIGGVFSMMFNLKNLRFEEEIEDWVYWAYGAERLCLALLAGVVAAIGVRSKFIFGNLIEDGSNGWPILFLVVLAGFSERVIPSLMAKYEGKG